mmetsp:Transcript_38038/g.101357  ORF Transcript_38038/g.101357 Transcript_38038/m.101357 type:complete len:346 (+) Transcript_38038:429-1466(+)
MRRWRSQWSKRRRRLRQRRQRLPRPSRRRPPRGRSRWSRRSRPSRWGRCSISWTGRLAEGASSATRFARTRMRLRHARTAFSGARSVNSSAKATLASWRTAWCWSSAPELAPCVCCRTPAARRRRTRTAPCPSSAASTSICGVRSGPPRRRRGVVYTEASLARPARRSSSTIARTRAGRASGLPRSWRGAAITKKWDVRARKLTIVRWPQRGKVGRRPTSAGASSTADSPRCISATSPIAHGMLAGRRTSKHGAAITTRGGLSTSGNGAASDRVSHATRSITTSPSSTRASTSLAALSRSTRSRLRWLVGSSAALWHWRATAPSSAIGRPAAATRADVTWGPRWT